ncbi:MAG: 30S ribosomal protein S9 [Chitinivibrionales bacterium]|nr:30S ribosomal protein S9 [Chitinivibrionales bacterium]
MENNAIIATGKRKNAIASVILKPGKGERKINGRSFKDYIKSDLLLMDIERPFELFQNGASYDVSVKATGGGISGQAGAIRLGIARALASISEEYRKLLRSNDFLTRDSRVVERKKYGMSGARKRFQFSKR